MEAKVMELNGLKVVKAVPERGKHYRLSVVSEISNQIVTLKNKDPKQIVEAKLLKATQSDLNMLRYNVEKAGYKIQQRKGAGNDMFVYVV